LHPPDETRRLRALWALKVTGGLSEDRVTKALSDASAYVRAWAIQLALEDGQASATLLQKLAEIAQKDSSADVCLYLASGMPRLPLKQRWKVMTNLVAHAEDVSDPNLP
jgi:hypothetical protein